jgi:hypothetical protein
MALPRRNRWDHEIADFLRWRDRRAAGTVEDIAVDDESSGRGQDLHARIAQIRAVIAGYERAEAQLERRLRRLGGAGDPAAQAALDDSRTGSLYRAWGARLAELRALCVLAGLVVEGDDRR